MITLEDEAMRQKQEMVKCKVLRGFALGGGNDAKIGDTISLLVNEALVKQSQRKVTIIEPGKGPKSTAGEISSRDPQPGHRDPTPANAREIKAAENHAEQLAKDSVRAIQKAGAAWGKAETLASLAQESGAIARQTTGAMIVTDTDAKAAKAAAEAEGATKEEAKTAQAALRVAAGAAKASDKAQRKAKQASDRADQATADAEAADAAVILAEENAETAERDVEEMKQQ